MGNINNVILEGNLVKAAELSHWNDGTAFCRFTIANSESYKDANGQWQDVTSFIDCQLKGNYAESMAKHLLKGRRVTVAGRLKQTRWTDENGGKHSAVFVKVQDISLSPLTQKNQQDYSAPEPQQNYGPQYPSYQEQPAEAYPQDNFQDSVIPF